VTTILQATKSPQEIERLAQWQERIGRTESEAIRQASSQRGKQLHRVIEEYWEQGRTTPIALQHQPWDYWHSLEPVLAEIEQAPLLEGFVWHPSGFAGVTDALVVYKGELCLCDWKTSAKPKRWNWIQDYCLQVAAYTAAVNRVYQLQGIVVRRGLVVVALPQDQAQVFELEPDELLDYWHQFQARHALFQQRITEKN
jgi:genome maintenance exonuclease 1